MSATKVERKRFQCRSADAKKRSEEEDSKQKWSKSRPQITVDSDFCCYPMP